MNLPLRAPFQGTVLFLAVPFIFSKSHELHYFYNISTILEHLENCAQSYAEREEEFLFCYSTISQRTLKESLR